MAKDEGQKPPTKHPRRKIERRTSTSMSIWTDLFKLKVASFLKREGLAKTPDENPGDFVNAEHVHFFRTFDSDGNSHNKCNSIGGHFHLVKTEKNPDDPDGPPHILEVSPPMVLVAKKRQGRGVLEPVPLNSYDFHTHEIEYIKSEKVQARAENMEAAKVMAYDAQKGPPVAGVIEK